MILAQAEVHKLKIEIDKLNIDLALKEKKEKDILQKSHQLNEQLTKFNEQKQKCSDEMDAIAKSIEELDELVQKVRENKDKYDNMTDEQMNILLECKRKEDMHKGFVKTLK